MQQFIGRDAEVDYLLTIYDEDQPVVAELATRPIGGGRWGVPTRLEVN